MAINPNAAPKKDRSENVKNLLETLKGQEGLSSLFAQNEIIIAKVESNLMQQDPANAAVGKIARDSRSGARTMRRALDMTNTPSAIMEEAKKEATMYLDENSGKGIDIHDFGALKGLKKKDDNEAYVLAREEKREFDATQRKNAFIGDSQEDKDRLIDTLGLAGHPGNDVGKIIKACIPCGRRSVSPDDIEFSTPSLKKLWEGIKNKLKDLKKQLEALSIGDEAEQDLCDILKFFDSQCLPDLAALLALFGMLWTKYQMDFDSSWKDLLNMLLGPFLTPIIAPLVVNINKYLNAVVDPIVCVLNALEYQMGKIDIIDGIDKFEAQQQSYDRKKIDFYERKKRALEERQRFIKEETDNAGTAAIFPRHTSAGIFTPKMEDRKSESQYLPTAGQMLNATGTKAKLKTDTPEVPGVDYLGDKVANLAGRQTWRRTYEEENEQTKKDIDELDVKINKLKLADSKVDQRTASRDKSKYNAIGRGVANLKSAAEEVDAFKNSFKSIITDVVGMGNQGIQMIKDTFEMYRVELERLILGRVSTQEDQIALARDLQKLQRYMSLVKALIKIGKLRDKCQKGNDTDAMGAFVSAYKTEPGSSGFDFYQGQDSNGDSLMVIAPGGTTLSVTGLDFDELGNDELLGDVTIDDVQTTATFNDLNEAEEMNRKGILLDLGNIDEKDIKVNLKDAGTKKTSLDLRAEQSYVIIKNDFCSKAPLNFGSSESVRQWAELL